MNTTGASSRTALATRSIQISFLTRPKRRAKAGSPRACCTACDTSCAATADRRNRTPVVMLRRQAHGARLRIVVVAAVGALDLHLLQSGLVQEMPGKLAAGARQVGPVEAVLRQHPPHPHLWAQHDRQQNEPCKREKDRHVAVVAAFRMRRSAAVAAPST